MYLGQRENCLPLEASGSFWLQFLLKRHSSDARKNGHKKTKLAINLKTYFMDWKKCEIIKLCMPHSFKAISCCEHYHVELRHGQAGGRRGHLEVALLGRHSLPQLTQTLAHTRLQLLTVTAVLHSLVLVPRIQQVP